MRREASSKTHNELAKGRGKSIAPSTHACADEILKYFEPVVDCIADVFGPNCEVVLHDVRDPSHSVTKICNGHVTGRRLGSPLTDLGLEILTKRRFSGDTLGSYRVQTDDGKTLRSNAVVIRDEEGGIVGMLCINWDITPLLSFEPVLRASYSKNGQKRLSATKYKEHYTKDLPTLISSMVDEAVRANHRNKRTVKKKEERLRLVRGLYHKGIFNARGAVNLVARALGVSNVLIYKYLEEIRR